MNCETPYTDCCEMEAVKPSQGIKLIITQLTQYLKGLVIVGAEDMSKIK